MTTMILITFLLFSILFEFVSSIYLLRFARPPPNPQILSLFAYGSGSHKVLVQPESNGGPGNGWFAVDYNDTAWKQLVLPAGYDDKTQNGGNLN
jgi:hypothetical protein